MNTYILLTNLKNCSKSKTSLRQSNSGYHYKKINQEIIDSGTLTNLCKSLAS
jgi:hypothetical protein